jgi:hypothetical protein
VTVVVDDMAVDRATFGARETNPAFAAPAKSGATRRA